MKAHKPVFVALSSLGLALTLWLRAHESTGVGMTPVFAVGPSSCVVDE